MSTGVRRSAQDRTGVRVWCGLVKMFYWDFELVWSGLYIVQVTQVFTPEPYPNPDRKTHLVFILFLFSNSISKNVLLLLLVNPRGRCDPVSNYLNSNILHFLSRCTLFLSVLSTQGRKRPVSGYRLTG